MKKDSCKNVCILVTQGFIIGTFLSILLFLSFKIIMEYYETPQATFFFIENTAKLPFPSITICLQQQNPSRQAYDEDVLKYCGIGK